MLKRLLEKDIIQRFGYSPAVALLGARQSGKTTLAKQIANKLRKKSIYIDLENPIERINLSNAYDYLDMHRDKLVIIDEVQLMPELFSILRPLIDAYRKNKRFLLLGSASPELVKGVSQSLAGRITYTYLNPFNVTELPAKYTQQNHWFRGGFPRAILARNDAECLRWHDDFIISYIERDLTTLFHVGFSKQVLRNFLRMIASAHGSIWNAQNFARSLGISNPTVNRYLDFMEGAFLVRKLPAWYVNLRKRIVKSPRIYIRDSGMLHRLCTINHADDIYGNIIAGLSWEGYVIEQISQLLPSHIFPHFYRTQDGAEADLALISGIKPIVSIEIKLSNAPKIPKGFYQAIRDLKTTNNFVITPGSNDYIGNEGIRVCCLIDFLKKHLPHLK